MTLNSLLDKLDREAQQAEYDAWRAVVQDLISLGIDINTQDKLTKDLIAWADACIKMNETYNR